MSCAQLLGRPPATGQTPSYWADPQLLPPETHLIRNFQSTLATTFEYMSFETVKMGALKPLLHLDCSALLNTSIRGLGKKLVPAMLKAMCSKYIALLAQTLHASIEGGGANKNHLAHTST